MTIAFKVLQEGTDELSVEVLQAKCRGCDAGPLLHEAEEETERVAVRGDGVLTCPTLSEEPLDEASSPGTGFLPEVCCAWEEAAAPARNIVFRDLVRATRERLEAVYAGSASDAEKLALLGLWEAA